MSELTNRELQVVWKIIQGLPYKEIAERLGISVETVMRSLISIYDKLGITNRLELNPLFPALERLTHALEESVRLQSHYAKLLNMHDGGERIVFESAEAWMKRLDERRLSNERKRLRAADLQGDASRGEGRRRIT